MQGWKAQRHELKIMALFLFKNKFHKILAHYNYLGIFVIRKHRHFNKHRK